MLGGKEGELSAYLTDFGFAHDLDSGDTNEYAGTRRYTAPGTFCFVTSCHEPWI
jgi:serine/threonine protein kinase